MDSKRTFGRKGRLYPSHKLSSNRGICKHLYKKALLTKKEAYTVAEVFMNSLEFFLIDEKVLYKSFDINIRYKYSFWDSLIIASALIAGCSTLYTEDM